MREGCGLKKWEPVEGTGSRGSAACFRCVRKGSTPPRTTHCAHMGATKTDTPAMQSWICSLQLLASRCLGLVRGQINKPSRARKLPRVCGRRDPEAHLFLTPQSPGSSGGSLASASRASRRNGRSRVVQSSRRSAPLRYVSLCLGGLHSFAVRGCEAVSTRWHPDAPQNF